MNEPLVVELPCEGWLKYSSLTWTLFLYYYAYLFKDAKLNNIDCVTIDCSCLNLLQQRVSVSVLQPFALEHWSIINISDFVINWEPIVQHANHDASPVAGFTVFPLGNWGDL